MDPWPLVPALLPLILTEEEDSSAQYAGTSRNSAVAAPSSSGCQVLWWRKILSGGRTLGIAPGASFFLEENLARIIDFQ